MKKVIKNPKKMKNAMYVVFGVFALALFVITRTGNSYATDGLMIDNALDSIILYGEVEQLSEDEEVQESQDEETERVVKQLEDEEEIVGSEENSGEETAGEKLKEDEVSEDLDETILERDSKEIDKSENEEEPQDKEENHGVGDENMDNEENKQEQKVEKEEIINENKEEKVETSEEFGFKTPENKITEEIQPDIIESEEIYGTGEYEGVKVEVYAQTGAFPLGTVLSIVPITGDDEMSDIQDVLEEQKNVEKTEKLIAFDITFLDSETNEELQPLTGTVQVSFNYEENEELKAAEQDEEQEVKVYHLNDKDEKGEKVEEIKDVVVEEVVVNEEESEECKIVVEAEKFSIYMVGNVRLKSASIGDITPITYNANGGVFGNLEELNIINYTYDEKFVTKYSHTSNISDNGNKNSDYGNSWSQTEVVTIPGADELDVTIVFGGESVNYDWVCMRIGNHSDYTAYNNCSTSVTGKLGGGNHTDQANTKTYKINGDTVTFSFRSDGSACGDGYGYYAVISGTGASYYTNENIEIPTREGFGFVGWGESGKTELFNFGNELPENNELYAIWKNNIHVKYDANGGYFKLGDSIIDEVDIEYSFQENGGYETQTNIQYPNRISEDISQQSGWMFAGWYMTEGEASTQTNEWTGYVTDSTENNMIVYAKWLPFNELKIGNGDSGMTIMDRNLGASEAGTGENSYGYYYQRGNNYGFPNDYNYNSSMYSSDMVEASGYGPSNYYSNSLFRRTSASWDSSNNGNLWGGEGDTLANIGIGTDEDRQGPCPEGYHIPSILERDAIYEVWNKASTKSSDYDSVGKNFAKDLKLPFVGWRRNYFGNPENRNTNGYYWTSSPLGDDKAYMINVNNDISPYGSYGRSYGISLRCFKNVTEKSKVSFYKESGEKISEIYLKGWEPIENKYLPLVSDREGYEFIGWFESGRNEEFDYFQFKTGDVDLYEKWINSEGIVSGDAKLVMGKNFNTIIKTLAKGDTAKYVEEDSLIKGIEKSSALPQGGNKKLISSEDSGAPIFAWYDEESQKIKYYTKAENVYMNEDSSYMFYYLKNLSSIDLDEFKTDYVTNMDWMFAYVGGYSLVEGLTLDFGDLNLSNVTSMANMFNNFFYQGSGATNVTINFSKMDLSNVKNVDKMFYYAFAYIENASGVMIDFSETDMSGVTDMYQMFYDFFYAYNAGFNINGITVDFSKANLSRVENMNQMFVYSFYDVKNISGIIIDFSEADMKNVKNMYQMFYYFCYGSTYTGILNGVTIDFSKADLRSVKNMNSMFAYLGYDFKKISGLKIDFTNVDMSSVEDMSKMFYDFCYSYVPEPDYGGVISGVIVDFSNADLRNVKNMSEMYYYAFAYAKTVTEIKIIFDNVNLNSIEDMSKMFYDFCYGSSYGSNDIRGSVYSGIIIDFNNVDLRNVKRMDQMFYRVFSQSKSIENIIINFSNKDTSTIEADGLTVDFSNVDLSSLENMYQMFAYIFFDCVDMFGVKIDFSNANLKNVKNVAQMFYDVGYANYSRGNYSGVVIDFSKSDLSSLTNMGEMFKYGFSYAKNASGVTINFSEANLSNVISMGDTFKTFFYGGGNYIYNITGVTLDFSKADLSSLTSMSNLFDYDFAYSKNLSGVKIDFSETNLSSVKTLSNMFANFGYGSNKTESFGGLIIDFSKADLSSVTSMSNMFSYGLMYLKNINGVEIDFSEADLSRVEDMSSMFYDFGYNVATFSGVTVDFSSADLSSVKNMSSMFLYFAYPGYGAIVNSVNIKWNGTKFTTSLENLSSMFASCGVEELDLSTFDTSNVTNMSSMFNYALYLKTIYAGSRFRTNNVTSSSNMFNYAPKLVGGRGTTYSDSNPRDKTYARVDSLGAPGYFTKKGEEMVATLLPGQQFNAKIKTIAKGSNAAYGDIDTYIKRIKAGTRDEMLMEYLERGTLEKVSTTDSEKPVYAWYSDNDKTIYYYSEANIIDMNTESSKMFYNLTKLEEVELDGIETHGVKNIVGMFEGCSSLTGINLSSLDTSSVTNTSIMFSGCDKLREVNMDGWDLTKVGTVSSYTSNNVTNYSYSENMGSMFYKCSSLEKVSARNRKIPVGFTHLFGRTMSLSTDTLQEIDVSGWNLSRTKSLQGLFADSKVRTIKGLETWNTSNIEDMNQMFYNCVNLIDFDISKFRTSKVTDMTNMFYNCQSITGLDLSHFDTKNVKSMNVMFNGCTGLETLNLDNWDLSNVYQNGSLQMGSMFYGNTSLKKLSVRSWKLPTIFSSIMGCRTTQLCSVLDELDVSDWDLNNTRDIMGVFGSLTTKSLVGLDTWDTSHIQRMENVFGNFSGVDYLDLSAWNTENVQEMDLMFYGANIKELNLSNFNTRNVSQMNSIFQDTKNLKTIYVGDEFKTDSVTNSSDMFSGAVSIVGGNGTLYDENHIDKEYARVDKSGTPGYFTLGEFNIIYNLDGGDMEDMKISYKLGESFTIGQPTKEENVFLGWTGSNGNVLQKEIEIEEGTKGDLEFTANWKINQYKIMFDTDGGNAINPVEIDYNSLLTGINLPTPTKECNEFSGWNVELPERMPAHDITLKAVWNYTCSKSSGGGGGGGGGSSTVKTKDDKDDHGVADEEKNINLEKEENKSIEIQDNQVVEDKNNQEITQKVDDNNKKEVDTETVVESTTTSNNSSYTSEQKQSYEFAKSNGITTTTSIEQAKMNTSLTRIEMAKMLSYYAINVLGQEPDAEKGVVKFSDVTNKLDKEYDNGVTLAYQLGIMGQNMPNNKFRPNDEVTRAEFATALSRLLYNTDEGEYKGTRKYYEPHIAKLYNEGIINNTDSKMKEKRGYVMIMLMRTAK